MGYRRFVNHHVHSHFSTLDGLASPQEIVDTVVSLGQDHVSLTDHGTMSGIPHMYRAAKKAGIGFTPGCEMYFAFDRHQRSVDDMGEKYYHLIVLAENNTGYSNLMKLQTPAWNEGFYYKPRVDYELLDRYHEGLIVTTACLGGVVQQCLLRGDIERAERELGTLIDIFGRDNVYMEVQLNGDDDGKKASIVDAQIRLAKKSGILLLPTVDSHYATCGQHDVHDTLIRDATRTKKHEPSSLAFPHGYHLYSYEEMEALFPEDRFPGALDNTVDLAHRTSFHLDIDDDKRYIMPHAPADEGLSEIETLRNHVYRGAHDPSRYGGDGTIPEEVSQRIEYEIDIIEKMGFAGYFLLVENIVSLFADNGIFVGPGRGSAPGSVVIYCLGITAIDPLHHGLFFERFLNPDRVSMPDIDIDIPKSQRKRALELIEREYGKGHVAHISNYGFMGMREALTRTAKVYGATPAQAGMLSEVVGGWCDESGMTLFDAANYPLPEVVLRRLPKLNNLGTILHDASKLEGTMYANGVHACGIVITNEPTDHHFPVRVASNQPLPVCQFDGKDIEALGGVKMDILGLTTLDECSYAERNIELDLGEKVDSRHLPLDDPKVFDLLSKGKGDGVFQFGCIDGSTLIDGVPISQMYENQSAYRMVRSVRMGTGMVDLNEVVAVYDSGYKQCNKVTLRSGHSLVATPEHIVFSRRGWIPLGEAIAGKDYLLTVSDVSVEELNPQTPCRDREAIMRVASHLYPDFERIVHPRPVTAGYATFYPSFVNTFDDTSYLLIVDDDNIRHATYAADQAREHGYTVIPISFSQVIEHATRDSTYDPAVPASCSWSIVESNVDVGIRHTYDMTMTFPLNNYCAGGIMTHNSDGIQSMCKDMKPERFEDMVAGVALYRPGPMGSGVHTEYARRKNIPNYDWRKDLFHPDAYDALRTTYGLMCYQEQVMSIARTFAGFSGGEADTLRKAMAKKNLDDMERERQKFVPAVDKRYYPGLGQEIWDIVAPFSSYAFNLSHAAAYATTSYRTAWLKAHYPAQLAGAVVDCDLDNRDKLLRSLSWIRDSGITISPPAISSASLRCVTTENSITLPLHVVKGVGEKTARIIIDKRDASPYTSLVDVIARTSMSASLVSTLAQAGCLDGWGLSRAGIVFHANTLVARANAVVERSKITSTLFSHITGSTEHLEDISDLEEPRTLEIGGVATSIDDALYASWERNTLGVVVGPHPYLLLRDSTSPYAGRILRAYPPIDEFTSPKDNAKMSGVVVGIEHKTFQSKKTGDMQPYVKFFVETDRAVVPAVAFSDMDDKLEGSIVAISGTITDDSYTPGAFSPQLRCQTLRPIKKAAYLEEKD